MKRQWLVSLAYVLLGMLLLGVYEHGASEAALFIYKNNFVSSLIACQLAKAHSDRLAKIDPSSSLGRELQKTSLIDLMTCDGYQSIRNKLLAAGVGERRLKIVEADILNREPDLITQNGEGFSLR